MRRNQHAFTLIELMIAVALMVILTGSIVFVFTQAQRVYTQTDAAVRVYQNARTALDTMERDLANTYRTMEMEFWGPDDKDSVIKLYNGHLDQTMEPCTLVSDHNNVDWSEVTKKSYRDLKNYRILAGSSCNYMFSLLVKQGEYTDGLGVKHRSDEIYFKTETAIPSKGGIIRTALVRYGLFRSTPTSLPILMKWVIWLDKSDPIPKATAEQPQPLCYFVSDFKIKLYIRNKRSNSPGDFYNAKDARENFVTPISDSNCFMPVFSHVRANGGNSKGIHSFSGYAGADMPVGKVVSVLSGEPYFTVKFPSIPVKKFENKFFYQLDKGDKIFLFDPDTTSGGTNYLVPPGEYTIKDIRLESGKWKIYFREALDTTQLDKEKKDDASMSYRASWLPSSIQINMKIIDDKSGANNPNQISRTIVRVFRILGS